MSDDSNPTDDEWMHASVEAQASKRDAELSAAWEKMSAAANEARAFNHPAVKQRIDTLVLALRDRWQTSRGPQPALLAEIEKQAEGAALAHSAVRQRVKQLETALQAAANNTREAERQTAERERDAARARHIHAMFLEQLADVFGCEATEAGVLDCARVLRGELLRIAVARVGLVDRLGVRARSLVRAFTRAPADVDEE